VPVAQPQCHAEHVNLIGLSAVKQLLRQPHHKIPGAAGRRDDLGDQMVPFSRGRIDYVVDQR
jgi:hypothetical protein